MLNPFARNLTLDDITPAFVEDRAAFLRCLLVDLSTPASIAAARRGLEMTVELGRQLTASEIHECAEKGREDAARERVVELDPERRVEYDAE